MPQPVTRRLAAILAADVAAYSRLMGADEEETLARLRAHRRKLIEPKIRQHHGRLVKTTGDGLLADFPSVVDAVRCAAEIQRAMLEREATTSEERRILFRIGVNLGDVICEDDDIFGDGVNVAARLESLAEPGGFCISEIVREQVRNRLPYAFEDRGEQSVKNIVRPLRIFAMGPRDVATLPLVPVADVPRARTRHYPSLAAAAAALLLIAAAGWWAWPRGGTPPMFAGGRPAPALSIVVLPFANLSDDPAQEYFADGITDDLTTDLSQISGSFVIARTTAFTYKGKAVDVKQIGRDLGVRYVLEGSVRRSGNQVHVNVQLIDAETEAHVWADQFDTDRSSIAQAQNEITARLARTLNLELVEATARRLETQKDVNPDAQDLAMRGWAVIYRGFSAANEQEARQFFDRALALDPQSLDAKLGAADLLLSWTRFLTHDADTIARDQQRAEELLREVLEQAPNRSIAHSLLGVLRRLQDRLDESRIELQTAIADDPNNASALIQLGLTLMYLGHPDAGIPYIEQAIRLDPRADVSTAYWALGQCHLLLGEVDVAIDFYRKAISANPRLWYPHLGLAAALGLKGDLTAAQAELAEAIRLNPKDRSFADLATTPTWGNADYNALRDKTIYAGLHRAGLPER